MDTASRQPLVVDVRRNSLDDGPGIRTVVFLKGCPLRCAWCQNPEALSPQPQLQVEPERCRGCGTCKTVCPREREGDTGPCRRCGACVEACPSAARRIVGRAWAVEELVEVLAKDEVFYRNSQGGVTFSGGEPALWPEYVGEVARRVRERGIHTLLETAGHFDWTSFESLLLPHLSTIYFDLKLVDPDLHRRHIGVDNRLIRANLERLARSGFCDLLVRVPLVPGLTDTLENLTAIAALLVEHGHQQVALLPYNPLWIPKRKALGLVLPYDHDRWMSEQDVDRCRGVFLKAGLEVR